MPQAKQCRRKPAVILTSLNSLWARVRDNLESRLSKDILASWHLLKNIRLHYFPKQEKQHSRALWMQYSGFNTSFCSDNCSHECVTGLTVEEKLHKWCKWRTHVCVCVHMGRKAGDTDGVSLWKGLLRANTKVDSIKELISLIYRARYEMHRLCGERKKNRGKNTEGWMESAQRGVESLCKTQTRWWQKRRYMYSQKLNPNVFERSH